MEQRKGTRKEIIEGARGQQGTEKKRKSEMNG